MAHKVLLFCLFASFSLFAFATSHTSSSTQPTDSLLGRRDLLEKAKVVQDDDGALLLPSTKKKSPTSSSKNVTKITPKLPKKNQTKLIKPTTISPKNKTKLIKPTSNSTKSVDLLKSNPTHKNKTKSLVTNSPKLDKINKYETHKNSPSPPTWMYQDDDNEDDDLVSEFRDLPIKFQQTFIPDLHRISTTSKIYLSKANKQITNNFKPYVGKKYAPSFATAISCAFVIVPFLLVTLLFNRIKAYFSLQKLIIFIQIYLSIYFSILCFSSLFTGLEPLRFFYATSQSTYVWLQVLQTLGYVLYLLLMLVYLALVFSTDSGLGLKLLGLAQTLVGFAIGLHYYMTVFHKVVLRQPPKTNWKIHGIYATCFLVICLFARAERRKKAYLEEGGEEGKMS